MEIVTSIGGKVADYLFVAAGNQLGYLFYYNDNIQNLKKQVKNLADSRDMVQKKIEFSERRGEIIFGNVRSWIEEVDNISAKAERFLEDEDKANKRCLKGWCINLGQRYRFSKEAKKQTLAISEQLQEVGKIESVSSSDVFSSGSFASRNSIKKKIVKALVDDDDVFIIGICGMGGVGKTTLVKEMGKQLKDDKIYDTVVMAVVSQTPSIMRIQGEIADMLGATTSLPANSEIERASFLWGRIKERKRILVILDDVWGKIKLGDIGIPFAENHIGCKIVITSRSIIICAQMNCQKIFIVETLSKEESWALFKELAGTVVETFDINPIATDVAAKCGGLPIAIATIAGALKGKNKHVWSNAARQLQKSNPTSIQGMEGIVFSSLELSFNYLENVESKSLFLFCSLFPEDYRISVEDLVRYWIGLKWFGDTDEATEDARDRVHAIVSTITSYFLLIDDGEKYIKMHDVVRDFAITIAPRYNHKFMVKAGIDLKEWPSIDTFEDFTCISLMANNIQELPNGLECPKLQALLLQENKNLVVPSCFFQEMKDLKVLDLGQTYIETLPDSLLCLTNLRSLEISRCNLGNLSIIGKLSKLEILSLSKSSIHEIPVSFSQLTNLKLLDLNDCTKLTLLPSGVISSLKKLEELYINRFMQWQAESENLKSNVNLIELQALSRLTHLDIQFSNLELSPKLWVFQNNLSNFKLRIGYTPYGDYFLIRSSRYSRNMLVSQTNVSKIYDWVKGLLKRIEYLFLEEIANLESVSHNLVEEGFNELKYLAIRRCDEIKYLLDTSEWTSNSTFHNLEELDMFYNANLVELCHGQPPTWFFSKLKVLRVRECHKMLNVVPSLLLQSFQNLQTFEVDDCGSLVYIFDCKDIKIAKEETKLLSSLEYLHLTKLPELSHIWKGDYQSISLRNLKRVEIYSCFKLIKLFSATLFQSLICLEEIKIDYCNNLEEIFEKKEGLDEELDHTITPSLKYLELKFMSELSHIWKGDHQSISLCNLMRVILWSCAKLIKLFSPTLLQSLICLEGIEIRWCNNLEEIFEKKEGLDKELDHTITSPSLGNLTSIEIGGCRKFKNLFTPSIVKCLVKLKRLELWNCSTIQEIVTNEKGDKETSIERIMFPSLYYLGLIYLYNLTCFSSGSYTIEFPALESLEIIGCGKMKTFGHGEQVTPKLNKVFVNKYEERWNSNLNATVQEYFNEKVCSSR